MSRPSAPEDLRDYERSGHTVAIIHSQHIIKFPSLGQHLLAALAEAERLGLQVEDGEIIIPLTEGEVARLIENAQRSWDNGKEQYEKYLATGKWPQYDFLWNAYLTAEGIEAPKKEEAAA